MKSALSQLSQRNRPLLAEVMEALLVTFALGASFLLRFDFQIPRDQLPLLVHALPIVLAGKLIVFRIYGLRQLAWRHIGFEDLLRIAGANVTASIALAGILRVAVGSAYPRSIYVLDLVICLMAEVAARALIRILCDGPGLGSRPGTRRTLIYGAGKAGITVLAEIRAHRELSYQVEGFLDDDPAKQGMRIHGLRVVGGREQLPEIARKLGIEEILIALPTVSASALTEILEQCHAVGVAPKRVPALAELMEDKVLVDQIREVRLEDLLGRPPVSLEQESIRQQIAGRVVLVTGAGGSIGGELCRQIARHHPCALVGFDQAETALYQIEQELRESFPDVAFYPEIGSIQDVARLEEVFAAHRPDSVYHAAAYKHVPMMEAHLFEAISNNIFGTQNVARAAIASGVREFVLISSDKAVRPTNVMGATKRVAEMVALAEHQNELNRHKLPAAGKPHSLTNSERSSTPSKIVAVRFGNVLGSNGSVIPRFRQQIARGGPLTVTHPEMRRFFMTIPEAAQLVIQAGCAGSGGEILVLEMGEPVRILDLARKMVLLSGLRPEHDIPIVFSGLRPGEKMYEELSAYEENTVATPHRQIRVFTGPPPSSSELQRTLTRMDAAVRARDAAALVMCLKDLIPDYNPSSQVLRQAFQQKAQTVVA